jgi:hypothetical protein
MPDVTAGLSPEDAERLAAALASGLGRDLGGGSFPNAEGWRLTGVRTRLLQGQSLPVAAFTREERTLCFIVTPTDDANPAYRRVGGFDVVYFSEDVPDAEQHRIYERDRPMIDRFVAWIEAWAQRRE